MFMSLLCIYKKPIILSLFKIDTLNFTMYILTILTCPLKTYLVRLHNLTSMNIFFTIDHKISQAFFVIVKRKQYPISMNIDAATRGASEFLFIKVSGLRPSTLIKKRPWHSCFPLDFAKFLRKLFLQNTIGGLLLYSVTTVDQLKSKFNYSAV